MAKQTSQVNTGSNEIERPQLRDWLRLTNINDLVTSEMHSRDFNGSRAEYIYMRVRLLALLFALLALLWIPVDILIVPTKDLGAMLGLRITYITLFLVLGMIASGAQKLFYSQLRLTAFVLIPCVFYVCSRLVISGEHGMEGALVGYSFLPYLTVALLAIFPLTLYEGTGYALLIGGIFISSEIYFAQSLTITSLGNIWLLTLLAGIAIWAQLSQLHMLLRLYREASRDPLTGLVNRRVLNKWLALEISRAREHDRPLTVLLFDLDFFKHINDTYGHLTGDRVLQSFSRLLKRDLANYNLIGRYGGEEFIVVLTGQDEAAAMAIAEHTRKNCHSVQTRGPGGSLVKFTTSVGVTGLNDADTVESLIHRVDKGLYSAKMRGRDTVVLAEVEDETSNFKERRKQTDPPGT